MSAPDNKQVSGAGLLAVVAVVIIGILVIRSNAKVDGLETIPQLIKDAEYVRLYAEQNARILKRDQMLLNEYDYDDARRLYENSERTINSSIQSLIAALQGNSVVAEIYAVREALNSANQFNDRVAQLHEYALQGPTAQNAPGPSGGGVPMDAIKTGVDVLFKAQEAVAKARAESIRATTELLEGQKWKPIDVAGQW